MRSRRRRRKRSPRQAGILLSSDARPSSVAMIDCHSSRPECGEESVAKGVHPPSRGLGTWLKARLPTPLRDAIQDGTIARDDRDRYVAAGARAGDDRRGLMIAEEDEHQFVVAVVLHV